MPRMSGAETLAALLLREGVDLICGVPGVQIMDTLDAINRSGKIRWISTRHEQTAAYIAYGYALTTGKIGVAMVLPGPGALNTAAAIGTAYSASVPVLLISGQIPGRDIGLHRGVLHEFDEQIDVFRYLTKYCARAMQVEDIPDILYQALNRLKTGRARPVEIEIPYDLWSKQGDMKLPDIERPTLKKPAQKEISKAAAILVNAKYPLILAGRGAISPDNVTQITRLAEQLHAPVVMTPEGQGLIPSGHPFYAGNSALWLNPVFKQADSVIIIGSRLCLSGDTQLSLKPEQKVIQLDCDPAELGRNIRIDLGISADVNPTLSALNQVLGSRTSSFWQVENIARLRDEFRKTLEKSAPLQMAVISSIHEVLGDDGILVPDITNIGYWCDMAYPVEKIYRYINSAFFATLGYAFPTALGAKLGNPDKAVVAVCGDGGFPYASAELATAVQEKINVVTIVFSDNAYGTITGIQRNQFGGKYIGNKLHNPDYVKFAEAFGAVGMRVENYKNLGEVLIKAIALERPVIIEVPVPQLEPPWDVLKEET